MFIQHVIVTVIQMIANMMLKLIIKGYQSIFMEIMKVEVFVKIVNTILKESIVINVNQNTIDHMEDIGMKPMFVDVCDVEKNWFLSHQKIECNKIYELRLQLAIVTNFFRLVIVKKKQEDVNVE